MTSKPINIKACALALGATLAVAAGGTGFAQVTGGDAAEMCDVRSTAAGGGFALEAVYHAQSAAQGTYQFSVKSVGGSGGTTINQGGGFSAKSGETLTLGRVTVGGAAAYDVTLKINAGGAAIECGGRISLSA